MSRRGRASSSKKGVANGPPPSHPSESYREHRKFLIRSLERNDVDMNAIVELNKSLLQAKKNILENCGELILLDLGSGRLKLINDELHEEIKAATDGETILVKIGRTSDTETEAANQRDLTPSQIKDCVDFLLRMKLRRKLSSRLIRRLTRLAHVMDGKDIYPPSTPKYGDLRLQIDPKSLETWQAERKEAEEARQRVKNAIDSDLLDSSESNRELGGEEKEKENAPEEAKPESEPTGEGDKEKVKENVPDETTDAPDGEPKDGSSNTGTAEDKPADDDTKESDPSNGQQKHHYLSSVLLDDFKLLKELDSSYEKTWDPATKSFNYSIASEETGDPDYKQHLIKGGGIGATSMFHSLETLEAEHKRWQMNLLRKIQEQPNFEELGLKHRVFHFEERKKRCLEEVAIEDGGSIAPPESPNKKAKMEGEDNANSSVADNETKMKTGKETGKDAEENSDSDDDEGMAEGGNNSNLEDMKPKRSISFAATPSFHDQDLARIRAVHRDLLTSSQAELTRKRLNDATNEYNKGKICNMFATMEFLRAL